MTGIAGFLYQLVAGIGDERRAGIADQSDAPALGEGGKQFRSLVRRIVVVIGDERRLDAIVSQEHDRDPRILAGDHIGGGQRLKGPQRNIAEIADRGGNHMQAGFQRTGRQAVAADGEEPLAGTLRHTPAAFSGRHRAPFGPQAEVMIF